MYIQALQRVTHGLTAGSDHRARLLLAVVDEQRQRLPQIGYRPMVTSSDSDDLWAWQSPVLEFSYFERQGPALVDLALFGYVAVRLIRPTGLAAIRHT